MIAQDALKIADNPPSHSQLFGKIVGDDMGIITRPITVQIQQLDKLQPLLPYVLFANAARDVAETLGKNIRDPGAYAEVTQDKKELIATRIREINRMMTEGWIRHGQEAVKVKIGGFDSKELANLQIFLSTYLKALVTKDNAAEFLTHEPVFLEAQGQTLRLDTKAVALLETARLPQPDLPDRT